MGKCLMGAYAKMAFVKKSTPIFYFDKITT